MTIKDHALIVSLSICKPQMTQKDQKATIDAERANNAHGAGQYRKDLYPRSLIQPILTLESSARAYMASTTYPWNMGEYLLPTGRFMTFADRMGKFELEFNQAVTAFLNNWANVMAHAQATQGALFDPAAYPDLTDLRSDFRFRVSYRPVTDAADFRVSMQEDEIALLKAQAEVAAKESMDTLMREPLERLREVVAKLSEVASRADREVVNKRTGATEIRPPIFRDSVCDNIIDEINLLRDFAGVLPDDIMQLADAVQRAVPSPQALRDDPVARTTTKMQANNLLSAIDQLLED